MRAPEPKPGAKAPKEAPKEAPKKAAASTVVVKNSFEDLEVQRQSDVDKLVQLMVKKLKSADAKHAKPKFMYDSVKSLQGKLTLAEAESLHKTCKDMYTKRKKKFDEEEKI